VQGLLELELPKGENLLIFGENGAGKSSVFWALRDFLESAEYYSFVGGNIVRGKLGPTEHRNRFTTEQPRVALHFKTQVIAWSEKESGPQQKEARDLDKGKVFLDYKALMAVHYLPYEDKHEVDLFPLLIWRLLP
jgi:ABC-type glutathione transport system ATPase component